MSDLATFIEEHRENIVSFLSGAIAIDSVTGNEGPVAEYCADWLRSHGIEVTLQPCKGRHNVVAWVGEGNPALVMSGHIDTVPINDPERWTFGAHNPTVQDGKLYGLGTSDMKASLACAFFAALYLKERDLDGRFVAAYTIEEETTGDGTELFLQWAEQEKFLDFSRTVAVVSEPTGLDHISLGNRGSTFVKIEVKGKGGHGSRPHLAHNPILKVNEIVAGIAELEARWREAYPDEDFGGTSLTPTSVNAGDEERSNVIPEVAHCLIDCRPTPLLYENDFRAFRSELETFLRGYDEEGFEITWSELYPREGHKLAKDHEIATLALSVLRDDLGIAEAEFRYTPAGNDAVYFGIRGIPTLNKLGPGHSECAHIVDEYVTIDNLFRGIECFARIGERYLGK